MKIQYMVVAFSVLFSAAVVASDDYLCTGESATGFRFDENKKQWRVDNFAINKYVVSKNIATDLKSGTKIGELWIVEGKTSEGKKGKISIACKEGINDSGILTCDVGFLRVFYMNKTNMQFFVSSTDGFWHLLWEPLDSIPASMQPMIKNYLEDLGADSPFLEIGKCIKR